jgi:hypothetical protein
MFGIENNSMFKNGWGDIRLKALVFFEKNVSWMFFVFLIVVTLYGSFVWYEYIYGSDWDEAKKQEYTKSKDRGVVLNGQALEGIVKEREKRQNESKKEIEKVQDIFHLNP